jgi:hypothetical protein
MKVGKIKKMIGCMAISLAMTMNLFGHEGFTLTAYAESEKTIACLGTSAIKAPQPGQTDSAWKGNYVWYGKYNKNPVKYRVLDPRTIKYTNENQPTMFLDCDNILYKGSIDDGFANDGQQNYNDWTYCKLKFSLNGEGFLYSNFTTVEQNSIANSSAITHDITVGAPVNKVLTKYKELRGEKIFLLDFEELLNSHYGYAADCGYDSNNSPHDVVSHMKKYNGEDAYWWLRTPSSDHLNETGYVDKGRVGDFDAVAHTVGVSPAFNVKLSSVLFSSVIRGTVGGDDSEYKFTLLDNDMNIELPTDKKVTGSGNSIVVPYSMYGSNINNATQISVLILDKSYVSGNANGAEILYYGKLNISGTLKSEGEGTFTFPSNLKKEKWGKDYKVYIIAEDVNLEKETDYASEPKELTKAPSPWEYHVKVTSDGNGTASASVSKGENGDAVKLTAVPNERYQFKEWRIISGNIAWTDIDNGIFKISNSDVEIEATFEPLPKISLVFDANDGSGTLDEIKIDPYSKYTLPACTFKAPLGKEFVKWDKGEVGTEITITPDTTLRAIWREINESASATSGTGEKTVSGLCTDIMKAPEKGKASKDWTGSYVWYGMYAGVHPVKYRVLAPETTKYTSDGRPTMFLDCDSILFNSMFDNGYVDDGAEEYNDWTYCKLNFGLNGSDFLDSSFSRLENNAIANSYASTHAITVGAPKNNEFKNYKGLNGEKIFLLDFEDVLNTDYGYASDCGYDLSDNQHDVVNHMKKYNGTSSEWWLRTPSSTNSQYSARVDKGSIRGGDAVYGKVGVSPAFNINRSSILFSSVIEGKAGENDAEYKLTLLDDELKAMLQANKKISARNNVITVPYAISGADSKDATQMSVLVLDKRYEIGNTNHAKVLYYGKMNVGNTFNTTGVATFGLPDSLAHAKWGTEYHVYILAEDVNREKETDYASYPKELAKPTVWNYDEKIPGVITVKKDPKKGDIVMDEATQYSYTVTSVDKTFTVTFNSTANNKITTATIPDEITINKKKYKVTEIKANAFKNHKKLKKITIGKNIKKIGQNAFSGCTGLKTIIIKTTKLTGKTVGKNAFKNIHKKAKVRVPGKKLKSYKSILKARGMNGKKQKIQK